MGLQLRHRNGWPSPSRGSPRPSPGGRTGIAARGLQGPGATPEPVLDDEQRQRAWASKVGGGLLLAGSFLVVTILTLGYVRHAPAPSPDSRPLNYALCVPTIILGAILLRRRKPVPAWLLNTVPSFTAILICIPTSVDSRPGPLGPVLLTWPVVFAAYVLSVRVAWITMAVVAGAFAVLASLAQGYDGFILWFEITAAITVVCFMVINLRRQADKARAEVAGLARTDPLTGLANRRGFDQALRREYAQRQRNGWPLSLLAVDIDHFKQVNDVWGHPAGDVALQSLGRLLSARVRASDTVGRIGGEEFAVLMPDCPAEQAHERAVVLCHAVRTESERWEHRITVSIGYATSPNDAATPAELRQAADAALYRAKDSGRDRVEGASPVRPS